MILRMDISISRPSGVQKHAVKPLSSLRSITKKEPNQPQEATGVSTRDWPWSFRFPASVLAGASAHRSALDLETHHTYCQAMNKNITREEALPELFEVPRTFVICVLALTTVILISLFGLDHLKLVLALVAGAILFT